MGTASAEAGLSSMRFGGRISALARLLDWWAHEHGILFVISAGNIGPFRCIKPDLLGSGGTHEVRATSDGDHTRLVFARIRKPAWSLPRPVGMPGGG